TETTSSSGSATTIAISIQDVTVGGSGCYAYTSNAFNVACPNFFPAQGTVGNWTFTGYTLTDGHRYIVTAQGTDLATNVQSLYNVGVSSSGFIFDQRLPTSQVLGPSLEQIFANLPSIAGTASGVSLLTPLSRVQLSIGQLDLSDNSTSYYDGSFTFVGSTEYFHNTLFVGQASGTWTFNTPVFSPGKYYVVRSKAVDQGGNAENFAVVISTRFLFDNIKSTGAVTGMAGAGSNSSYYRTINPLIGTAFDGPLFDASAGLETRANGGAQVRIYDVGLGQWWNSSGGDFNQPSAAAAWVNASAGSAAAWTYSNAALDGKLTSGNRYLVQFRAKDKALPVDFNQGPSAIGTDSNFTLGVDSITFTADTVPPLSRITAPGAGTVVKVLTSIGGPAADVIVNNYSSGIS
ncbi:MAG: hypothetical protein AAB131_01025, partial [Actinomycetota bacterium]